MAVEHPGVLDRARAAEAILGARDVAPPERDPAVHREQLAPWNFVLVPKRRSATSASSAVASVSSRAMWTVARKTRHTISSRGLWSSTAQLDRLPGPLVGPVELEAGKRRLGSRREREGEVAAVADRAAPIDRVLARSDRPRRSARPAGGRASDDVLVLVQERCGGRARAGARSPGRRTRAPDGRRAGEAEGLAEPVQRVGLAEPVAGGDGLLERAVAAGDGIVPAPEAERGGPGRVEEPRHERGPARLTGGVDRLVQVDRLVVAVLQPEDVVARSEGLGEEPDVVGGPREDERPVDVRLGVLVAPELLVGAAAAEQEPRLHRPVGARAAASRRPRGRARTSGSRRARRTASCCGRLPSRHSEQRARRRRPARNGARGSRRTPPRGRGVTCSIQAPVAAWAWSAAREGCSRRRRHG